jgi:hypothetical protein
MKRLYCKDYEIPLRNFKDIPEGAHVTTRVKMYYDRRTGVGLLLAAVIDRGLDGVSQVVIDEINRNIMTVLNNSNEPFADSEGHLGWMEYVATYKDQESLIEYGVSWAFEFTEAVSAGCDAEMEAFDTYPKDQN